MTARLIRGLFVAFFLAMAQWLPGQASLPVYTDNLVNDFQDWGSIPHSLSNASPVHSGTYSISATASAAYQQILFQQPIFNSYIGGFDTTPYYAFAFWANGGATGGQVLEISAAYGVNNTVGPSLQLVPLPTNAWRKYTVYLSSFLPAGVSNLSWIGLTLVPGRTNTFYLDDLSFAAQPAPALQHLSVDASQTIRTADPRWFGANFVVWDPWLYTPQTFNAIKEAGILSTRFPGGSLSDQYHWRTGLTVTWQNGQPISTNSWANNFSTFSYVATNLGLRSFITVNYGSGTSNEAAAWVLDANVTNHCNFKCWEVGNECYGSWEQDTNNPPNDPYTYAVRFANYYALMKAADPTIEVGAVSVPGEDNFTNYFTHAATNSVTHQVHYGWTPVVLATLKSLGVTPDFLVYHFYPEYTDAVYPAPVPAADSDPLVLQVGSQIGMDATNLRMMINDYFGAGGTNIELVCTENNSDAGYEGRQSTSLVNAVYLADTDAQFMKTEFNAYTFWLFRGGPGTYGNFDPTLYGWRDMGDEGMVDGPGAYYPDFYAMKLLQYYVRPGDTVLNASSDYLLLTAYASRHPDGSLSLLVINKDTVTNFNAQISLANFVPSPAATVHSYGMPQDDAVENNLATNLQDIAVSTFTSAAPVFTNSFPPLSITVFTFVPAAPSLSVLPAPPSQFAFQLNGQPGTPYVIQTSSNLVSWSAVSTNLLSASSLTLTNAVTGSSAKFWRAVWQP